jgi:hypothetical protein
MVFSVGVPALRIEPVPHGPDRVEMTWVPGVDFDLHP